MEEKKKFILRAKTWHIGYYIGTVEEMCSMLNSFGVETTNIIDITPENDLGVTYNRAICTKMDVLGFDAKAKEAFLAEYAQLVKKYSVKSNNNKPKFEYGSVDWFFHERPIETDTVDVLIADDTTFRNSYFDKERNTKVCILSQRDFEPCSELNEEDFWAFLSNYCYFQKP